MTENDEIDLTPVAIVEDQLPEAEPVIGDALDPTETVAESAGETFSNDNQEIIWSPAPPSENFTQDASIKPPPAKKPLNDEDEWVGLPFDTIARTEDMINRMPQNMKLTDKQAEWAAFISQGFNAEGSYLYGGAYADKNFAPRKGSRFTNQAEFDGFGTIGLAKSKMPGGQDGGQKVSGQNAVLRIRAGLGLGGQIAIPCWHSGINVVLDIPNDAELLSFEAEMLASKITLGRWSGGAVFSNMSVMSANTAVGFLNKFIFDTSVSDCKGSDIWKVMKIHDFNLMVWGLAFGVYPNGFNYARAVAGKTFDDLEVVRDRINVAKTLWVDRTALTPQQVSHISKRQGSATTMAQVQAYQDASIVGANRLVRINDDIQFELAIPTVQEWLDSGTTWINSMVVMADQAYGVNADVKERDTFLRRQSLINYLRQYAHWIKAIHIGEDVCEERESIMEQLAVISGQDAEREAGVAAIQTYINDTTMALVAVPTVTEEEENKYPRFPLLLPIDPLSTFFILVVRRLARIAGPVK